MRKERHSVSKRLLAAILSAVMVFSMVPSMGVSAEQDTAASTGIISTETVTDAHTLDSWKDAFDPVNISTEHAGGIWTDKSVLTGDGISELGNISGLEIGENNFLAVLSALAANSIIVGQGSTPTDTVFVLDISGSMSNTELRSMVSAANTAIHSLLSGNEENRVGIVLYSTNAYTLLPLDHYTPVIDDGTTEYIELYQRENQGGPGGGGGTYIRTAQAEVEVESDSSGNWWEDIFGSGSGTQTETVYLTDSNGNDVNESVRTTGGTYIQGGLWEALGLFNAAAVSDNRSPVVVLMSDGAPTYTTNYYSDVPDDSNYGEGNGSTAADGFVTQLTAAYVKEQIAAKYKTNAYMYTLGLGVDDVTDSDVAKEVLDPSGNTHNGIESLWTTFNGLSAGQTMQVALGDSNQNNRPSVTYDATVDGKGAYVNRYFAAEEASDLSAAFQSIVNEISLNAGYYVTRLDGEDANLGGYITFIDEIGPGMQVKEIKGILIGEQLYSGAILAAALESGAFGTREEPTTLGDNMVWALKERLGLTDTEVARDLLGMAYQAGQLYYDETTGAFSNYIGWFGDSSGNFLGFWDAENPDAEIPEGAAFANKCYGMLGSTTGEQTNHASDMMYVAIQVSKPITDGVILDKSPETVTFRIPAALLPVVTYQIKLDGETVEESENATVTYKAAEPIRLLYEVGVHEKLNPINIQEFLRDGYQAKDENGNYYLYTNAWHWDGADAPGNDWTDKNNHPTKDNEVGKEVLPDTGKNTITYAYFEPGEDNEHYYFTENEDIYTKDGDSYTKVTDATQLAAGNTYYYQHNVFTTTQNGVENAGVITTHYEALSAEALQAAMGAGLTYVPAGTMHFYGHSHDRDKVPNTTGSYFAVRHHLVNASINSSDTEEHSYELVYMGNNGRVTYAPAQGISIEKQMADGSTLDVDFTFDVTLTAPEGVTLANEYQTIYVAADGTESGDMVSVTDGKATVSVKPGDTIYIAGIPAGTTYTVTERRSEGYLQSDATGATGTVPANDIAEAVFINRVRGVGSLNVVKTVTYLNGAVKNTAANSKTFPVTVTVTDGDVKFNGTVQRNGEDYTVTDGVIEFEITDGQTVTITGLPEGYDYVVAEGTLPEGYAFDSGLNLTGTITTAATSAVLNNTYTPEEVKINEVAPFVEITASKTLDTEQSSANFTFQFKLMQFDGKDWVDVYINNALVTTNITVTSDAPTATADLDLSGLTFTEAGTYEFRVVEVIPENKDEQVAGMTYDRTFHDFEIVVTDANLDGKLEISDVTPVGTHTQVTETADTFGVTTGFTNTYALNSTKLTIQAKKYLTDITAGGSKNMTLKDGQFQFILTDITDANNPVALEPESNGVLGDILFPTITYTEPGDYKYRVEEVNGGQVIDGYTYDDTTYNIYVTVEKSGEDLVITDIEVWKDGEQTSYVFDAATFNNILNGDTLTFNNTYKADPTTLELAGNKTLTNLTPGVANPDMTASIEANDYTFILTMNDGSQFKQENSGVAAGYSPADEGWISVNAGGSFSRSGLYFDEAGTYVFKLVEKDVNSTKLPGVTKDNGVYLISVVVVDNGKGALEVTSVTYTKDGIPVNSIVFNNTYKAEAADEVVLSGSKTLSGIRDIVSGEFSFELKDASGKVLQTVKNAGNNFQFTGLVFDTVGEYKYTISEVNGGQTIDGVTYDDTVYNVTVTVTDDGTGKLTASVSYGEGINAIAFSNDYVAASVKVALTGRKLLVGRPDGLQENEFAFILTGEKVANGSETVKNDADGTISFTEIEFTEKGTYTFTIQEDIPADADKAPGLHYDETVMNVTVTVTDDGKGQLVAQVEIPDQDVAGVDFRFFNRYHAEDTDPVVLEGTKELTGRPAEYPLEDDEFSFILKDKDGNVVQTVKNVGSKFTFTGLVFDAAGEYTYTIEEENGGATIKGVTYSNVKYDVTITVTDEGTGKLTASVAYKLNNADIAAADVKFVNTYAVNDTETVELSGKKDLQDRPEEYPLQDKEFSFTITGPNLPAEGETVSNDINGDFKFSELKFTAAGEYVYTVTEVHKGETINGVKYDTAVYTVTVNVTDNGEGGLDSTITYKKNGETVGKEDVVFTNVYDAADTDAVVLGAGKELTGRPAEYPLKDNEFSFTLTGPKVVGGSETVKNVGGKVTFTGLVFDTVGTYEYTITEVKGDLDYIDYDETEYKVIVEVKDLGTGKLTAEVIYKKDGTVVEADKVLFTNVYQPKATDEVELSGSKNLINITGGANTVMTPGNDYSFNLKGEGVDETVTNDGNSFTFSKLTFDKAGDHVFTITEVKGNKGGITYDESKYTVTVTVTDDGTGKLKVTSITYTKDGEKADKVVFENKYEAKPVTDVVIEAGKTLTDITGGGSIALTPEDDDFSFNLKGENVDETVKNVGGKVTFSLDFNKAGTYEYTITEVKGDKAGIGYDEDTVYDVTVTVTDNGAGQLVAEVKYSLEDKTVAADEVVFANTFKAADAELTLAGKKTLTGGRDLKAGEFSFNLKGEGVDETVTNALDGSFAFDTLKFDTVGEYEFTISEVKGSDELVKYDEKVYEITVTVSYDGEKMTAVAAVDGEKVDSYGFTNIFTPTPVDVTITAEKKLTNYTKQTMGLDGFTFQLTDGVAPVTKVSGTDGLAKFELSFGAVGTYTYKLTEVKGNVEDMTYDETVYDITVTVTQDPTTGALTASVSKTENAVFTNVYGTYEQPPKTADASELTRWSAMLAISAFSMLAVLVIGKKKLQEQ